MPLINYTTTKTAGNGTNVPLGDGAAWNDVDGVTGVGDPAWFGTSEGGQMGDTLEIDQFGFDLPDFAVIDGIEVSITGSSTSLYGNVYLGNESVDAGTLNTTYGSPTDLWGFGWTPDDINNNPMVAVQLNDVSGGDGFAEISLCTMTVYWHVELAADPVDVPTRVDYKVFSRSGRFLGLLPTPDSKLAFSQDKNSAGSTIEISCGTDIGNMAVVEALQTEDEFDILTEDNQPIMAVLNNIRVATGSSDTEALFKNSNIIEAWVYDKWHANGILMFTGQVNRVSFKYGGNGQAVVLRVFSEGYDLSNFIARGYPFTYTTDVTQSSQNGYVTVSAPSKGAGWTQYGQMWRTGAAVTNVGAITLKLLGTAPVTLTLYDGIPGLGGNLLGSVTKSIAAASATDISFEFGQLIDVSPSSDYYMHVSVPAGKSVRVYKHGTSATYANGSMYLSSYAGGSGGGIPYAVSGDFYFITKSGTPTTTTTYSTQDPVTGTMSKILLDYNNRGGKITEGDFDATGLSLTYTFNQATIYDALQKVLELSPTGFYSYIDLGTGEMDIKQQSTTADFTVVRGKDIHELEVSMSIEQVKNYLLFTGGPAPTTNLYRDYQDTQSASMYGLRTAAQSDNRVTVAATANAIGSSFIEEFSDEVHETKITILNESMDITLLTPGKTIGFKNFDNFIDQIVLQIVRREYTPEAVVVTLGRLPVRMNDVIQKINRGLLNEQTLANPSSPS